MKKLPTHEECVEAIKKDEATALQKFIHDNEPAGVEDSTLFRSQLSEAIRDMSQKADSYDEIAEKIAEFYDEDNGENDTDLADIGEWVAIYFGYL